MRLKYKNAILLIISFILMTLIITCQEEENPSENYDLSNAEEYVKFDLPEYFVPHANLPEYTAPYAEVPEYAIPNDKCSENSTSLSAAYPSYPLPPMEMCVREQCDPETNEIFNVSIRCGCRGQLRENLTMAESPLNECYINEDGYMCCNRDLEIMMRNAYENLTASTFAFDYTDPLLNVSISSEEEKKLRKRQTQNLPDIEAISSTMQGFLEELQSAMTYEVVIGDTDFAGKIQFLGNHMCKIRRNCKVILAFATPQDPIERRINSTHAIVPPNTIMDLDLVESEVADEASIADNQPLPNQPENNSPIQESAQNPNPSQNQAQSQSQNQGQSQNQQYQELYENQQYQQPYGNQLQQPYESPSQNQYYPIDSSSLLYDDSPFSFLQRLCFSADTQVWTSHGAYKNMTELQIGDYVLSSNLQYSRVKGWLHNSPKTPARFLKLYLNEDKMLKITEKHLIYKADCKETESHEVNKMLVFADELNIGDCLYVVNEGKTSVNVRQIIQIDIITEMGIFAPETENGDIVVNDIIASCYTDVKKESLVKTIQNVHSFIKRITGWFFDENTDEKVKISHGFFNIAMIIIEEIIPMGILSTSEMF